MENSTVLDGASEALLFDWKEYSAFSLMLVLSLLIGVYYGWFKSQDTVADYMHGGKKMSVFPITMSLIFSHVSGITLLGIPAEIYSYGTQYFCVGVACILVYFIMVHLYLPVFFELQMNSIFEYLEMRFSKSTRTMGSLIFTISLITYIPIVIYIPAIAFNQVTGVSIHVITPIVCFICIFYTSFGGLKAVVWTDTLQSIFTLGSIIFVIILGLIKVGSISEVIRINDEGHRLELFNFDMNPFARNTLWGFTLGNIANWGAGLMCHPGSIQRFIAVPTFKDAKKVMLSSCIVFFLIKILVISVGLLLYTNYYDCDPVATKRVSKVGQILPFYVLDISKGYPGLTGLFISGVLSAALSTMSASLNTVAGTLYEDFVKFVLKGKKHSEAKQNLMTKIITTVLGVLCIALVIVVEKLGTLFHMAVSLGGLTHGASYGLFTLGMFFPRANAKGAIWGSFASMTTMSIIVLGSQYYQANGLLKFPGKVTSVDGCPPELIASLGFNASARVQTWEGIGSPVVADDSVPLIFQVSYLWYSTLGALVTILVGLLVSHYTEEPELENLNPKFFSPPCRRLLSEKVLQHYKTPSTTEYILVNTSPTVKDEKEVPRKEEVTTGA